MASQPPRYLGSYDYIKRTKLAQLKACEWIIGLLNSRITKRRLTQLRILLCGTPSIQQSTHPPNQPPHNLPRPLRVLEAYNSTSRHFCSMREAIFCTCVGVSRGFSLVMTARPIPSGGRTRT